MAKKPEKEEVEEIPDWDQIVGLRGTKFERAAERFAEISDLIQELEKEEKDLKPLLAGLLLKAKIKKVMFNGRRLVRTEGSRSSISKELLLKNKVKQSVIEAATVNTAWISCRIFKEKETEE